MIDPITCMAIAIYFEARGEGDHGQVLVAETIMNRVHSPRYPDNICDVVMQKDQFSFYWDGKSETIRDKVAYVKSIIYAGIVVVMKLEPELPNVCHYARSDIDPYWAVDMQAYLVGNHVFYNGGC